MQSGNGMTMQEAEQEIKYYQKIFQVARLLKGEDVERTFYQQGKGTCENVQDGCPCYSLWKKNGKCENCSSYKALREKKQMIKLEFLESEVYQVISRYMEIDGQPYVMELINHLEDDTLIDISCREKLINKLTGYNEKLYKDVLTGVYNRLYFEEEIKMWTGNAGIVVIDVDDFKLCNDTYGHLTGDMALAAVAGVIWRCIRREDTLVRYGGDEFVLVLPEIKEDGLVEKLQEIQEKIQNAVIPGYSNIQLSVSMGAVISQNESVEHAMLRARKLMYQAKNKKNMAITENNMIDHEGKIHAQKQPEKMIPEILVVDDEEVNRTLLDMIFSKDYHVLQAESGEKCIEILEQLGIYQNEPLVKIAHQICRWHHERYDGKGYPDGLVGDEIPISAQVVSVADVYDALASERVYKKAVPHEKVLEMILHGECGQFNPILIECLQEISSRIRSECYDEEQET